MTWFTLMTSKVE